MSLTATDLAPLLDILSNPEHPAFNQALERITSLDPATLSPESAPLLLTQITTALENLARAKTLTATQLAALRKSGNALQSYTNR